MAAQQTYWSPQTRLLTSQYSLRAHNADMLSHHRGKATENNGPATAPAKPVKDATRNLPFDDTTLVIGLTVLASVVRLWNINYPDSVVFDEVHFGGFASKYSHYAYCDGKLTRLDTLRVLSLWTSILHSLKCSSRSSLGSVALMANSTSKT